MWISTLYFAQALPYVAVMTLSVIMYKRMGISNTDIALYTSWLYLPWVIKPFWSPLVDLIRTKRWWTVTMELFIGIGLGALAFTLPLSCFFQATLAVFWVVAFMSATHDIAADGFYMLALTEHQQSFYVGIRSTFYRIATIVGQGLLVMLAGVIEKRTGDIPLAWMAVMLALSLFFLVVSLYHGVILPRPIIDRPAPGVTARNIIREFLATFASFFKKKQAWVAIAFMLLYRLPEAQLVKLINPFLLDSREAGGLGLSTSEVGFVYGTVGIIGLTLGGIIGGFVAATVASRSGFGLWRGAFRSHAAHSVIWPSYNPPICSRSMPVSSSSSSVTDSASRPICSISSTSVKARSARPTMRYAPVSWLSA